MGAAAKYTLDIKDIGDVGPVVDMTVKLDKYIAYSYQAATSVQNELLSEVTAPGYYGATIMDLYVASGAIEYVPYYGDSFLKSATVSEGFQYAISYMHSNFQNLSLTSPATITAICQYSYNGNDWYTASSQTIVKISDNAPITQDVFDSAYASFIIPGNVDPVAVWTRWKIINDSGGAGVWMKSYSISMDIIPRHTHVWQQVGQSADTMKSDQIDDANEVSAATPETITCCINGGAPFAITCAAPTYSNNLDIKAQLVSGVNTIEFTSAEPCTVTPSANYLAFSA